MSTAPKSTWQHPPAAPSLKDGKPRIDGEWLKRWQEVTVQVFELATANGWTKAEASRRANMQNGTFNQVLDGTYNGNYEGFIEQLENWVISASQMNSLVNLIPTAPEFILTKTGKKIIQALQYAQAAPEFVIVSAAAGCGKTVACRHFAKNPHVHLTTMRPRTKSMHNMLCEIALSLGIKKGSVDMLDRDIGDKLKRGDKTPLLIIDEAQNLTDEAVDQARFFLDQYGCGIALVGNDEVYTRFAQKNGASFGQLRRRIGMRLNITRPYPEDIEALIMAWKLDDPEVAGLLRAIGNKAGALGQITNTMKLAGMLAAGNERGITAEDVTQAWSNRGAEA